MRVTFEGMFARRFHPMRLTPGAYSCYLNACGVQPRRASTVRTRNISDIYIYIYVYSDTVEI